MSGHGNVGAGRRALQKARWALVVVLALAGGALTATIAAGQGPFALTGTEGTVVSGTVGTVDETCGGAGEPDCGPPASPTITWGDGQTGTGTIASQSLDSKGANVDTVVGSHTFAAAGTYTATVRHNGGTGTGVISIADAPLTATGIPAHTIAAGTAFSGAVADFTDADPGARASLYSASVDWGDGSAASAATITATNRGFAVAASHTYAAGGTFTATVTIDDVGGSTAVASDSFTVSAPPTTTTTPTPPTSPPASPPPGGAKPVAAFTYNAPVLADVPVTFNSSGSTGTGLTYSWTFCGPSSAPLSTTPVTPPKAPIIKHKKKKQKRGRKHLRRLMTRRDVRPRAQAHLPGPISVSTFYCGYVVPPTSNQADPQFSFPYAPVHDAKDFPQGVDPVRRQETYPVTLTVTDASGNQSSVTHEVTVAPDTPLSGQVTATPSLLPLDGITTLAPGIYDGDAPTGQITEEDWYLGESNNPAIVCVPYSCSPGSGARSDPAAATPAGQEPPYTSGASAAARRAHFTTTGTPVTTRCPPSCLPPAFPAFSFDFAKQALLEIGLAPLSEIDLSQAGGPFTPASGDSPSNAQAEASFLHEYSYEVQNDTPLEYPGTGEGFSRITSAVLVAKDNAGQTITVHTPVTYPGDPAPDSEFSFIAPNGTSSVISQTSTPNFDLSHVGTSSPGGIKYYVLQVGTPKDPTAASTAQCNAADTSVAKTLSASAASLKKPTKLPGSQSQPTGLPGDKTGGAPAVSQSDYPIPLDYQALLSGVKPTRPAGFCPYVDPEISDPIDTLVTTNPALVANPGAIFANATPGATYSVMLTVYDSLGVSSRTRLDGFLVQANGCAPLPTQNITGGGISLGLSGGGLCSNTAHTLFWSQGTINLNGLSLKAENGGYIDVADGSGGNPPEIWTSTTPPAAPTTGFGSCLPVDLLIDGAVDGRYSQFCTSDGKLLETDAHPIPLTPATDAGYDSQPLAGLSINLGSGSSSQIVLTPQLPSLFEGSSDGTTGSGAATGLITIDRANPPLLLNITSKGSTIVDARRHHGMRPLPDYATAHAASGASDVLQVGEAMLGSSIPLPDGVTFNYDPDTGDWTGQAAIGIPGLPIGGSITVTIVFHGTSLVSATGQFTGMIPIAPGVSINGLDFGITEDPTTITSGITVSAVDILDGSGTLTVKPDSPWDVSFTGELSLADLIPLANATFDVNEKSGFSFNGGFSYDFGPASLSAQVAGQFESKDAWYVSGSGSACLGPCISVNAILSSIGVAACGSIDLVFTHVGLGVGYTWADHSLHLLGGSCDLSNYMPSFSSSDGDDDLTSTNTADAQQFVSRRAVARRAPDTFVVPAKQRAVAFQFTGAAGEVPPLVTLYEPETAQGAAGRTIDSPGTLGDYAFSDPLKGGSTPSVYFDENPLNDTTTVVVADPNPGTWSFSLDQGSPAVIKTGVATALPLPLHVATQLLHDKSAAHGIIQTGGPLAEAASASPRLPAFELPRVRKLRVRVPAGAGKMTIVEQGASGGATLLKLTGERARTTSVTFDPPAPGAGRQRIIAYYLGANDLPRASRVLETFQPPALPRIPAARIVKVLRRGSTAVLELSHAPLDDASRVVAYRVGVIAGTGVNQAFLVLANQVKHIGGHPAIIDRGLPVGVGARFVVWPEYDGTLGPASRASSLTR
jgi:hypothetical protein